MVDALGGIAEGDEVDVIVGEEAPVGVGVFVHADGDDGDLGEEALHLEETGEFFDAGGTPGGPEVQDDDMAAEFADVDGAGTVGGDELRCHTADAGGMIPTIAPCEEQGTQN